MPSFRIRPSIQQLKPSATLLINELSRSLMESGKTVYRLGFGQSPFPVPGEIVEELRMFAHEKDYLPVKGMPALREKVAWFNQNILNIPCDREQIMIGPGSKELILSLQMACDAVLCLPAPSWVSYEPQADIAQNPIEWVATSEDKKWLLKAEDLEQHLQSKPATPRILLLNYPSNPVGATYHADELEDLARVARAHDVLVVSDEIYGLLTHETAHQSIAAYYPEGTIVSSGLSKWCGAGGWRLGTFTFPKQQMHLLEAMAVVASESFSAVSAPIQFAAIKAFSFGPAIRAYVEKSNRMLRIVASYVYQRLRDLHVSMPKPEGGFYLFPNFEKHRAFLQQMGIKSSPALCERLLAETGIALLPGTAFGMPTEMLVCRLSYVDFDGGEALGIQEDTDEEAYVRRIAPKIVQAMDVLADWLSKGSQV